MTLREKLRFGTSGLRGLVSDLTDKNVYEITRGFLRYLLSREEIFPGEAIAVAEDLREQDPSTGLSSSPRIVKSVSKAAHDEGFSVIYCGKIPTPALAYFAMNPFLDTEPKPPMPSIMVTGSHIPPNRNGIKFYKKDGEILKKDEKGIWEHFEEIHKKNVNKDLFTDKGMFQNPLPSLEKNPVAEKQYLIRYLSLYPQEKPLEGMKIVLYEHSAVGRDLLQKILAGLGAIVYPTLRSDEFVSIDTENIRPEDEKLYQKLLQKFEADALVSTDGDSDRPLLVDETGSFCLGGLLGLITAEFLGARFAAVPVTVSDAIELYVKQSGNAMSSLEIKRTKIGSPYVIEAMKEANRQGKNCRVGWEANGGFLTDTPFDCNGHSLKALPTRDAVLPILAVLICAKMKQTTVSQLFSNIPFRASASGLIDNVSLEMSRSILQYFTPQSACILSIEFHSKERVTILEKKLFQNKTIDGEQAKPYQAIYRNLQEYFGEFGEIKSVHYLDGIQIRFQNQDTLHLRPSGNAPQFRVYSLSDSLSRAKKMLDQMINSQGILFQFQKSLSFEQE